MITEEQMSSFVGNEFDMGPLFLGLRVIQTGYWPVPFHSPRMKRCKLAESLSLKMPGNWKNIVQTIYQISTWNVLFVKNIFILKNLTSFPKISCGNWC